jgi:hypothetical protein
MSPLDQRRGCPQRQCRPSPGAMVMCPSRQLRRLGDVGGDALGLVAGEQLGRRSPSRLILEIDVRERLPVGVADDEAGVGLLDGPGRREAARRATWWMLSGYLQTAQAKLMHCLCACLGIVLLSTIFKSLRCAFPCGAATPRLRERGTARGRRERHCPSCACSSLPLGRSPRSRRTVGDDRAIPQCPRGLDL